MSGGSPARTPGSGAALASAFGDTFRVMLVAALAGAPLGLALRRPRVAEAGLGSDDGVSPVGSAAEFPEEVLPTA